jgi:hypothetical protein
MFVVFEVPDDLNPDAIERLFEHREISGNSTIIDQRYQINSNQPDNSPSYSRYVVPFISMLIGGDPEVPPK